MHSLRDDRHFVEIRHFNGYLRQHFITGAKNWLATLQDNRLSAQGDILLNRLALERRTVVVRRKVFGSERNLANGLITRETDRDE